MKHATGASADTPSVAPSVAPAEAPADMHVVRPADMHAVRPAMLRDLPSGEKPRERLLCYGPEVLATGELLAILLGSGRQGASALEVGRQLIAGFGLAGLARATVDDLCRVAGCGPAKAIQIKAALELGRRVQVHVPEDRVQVRTPADIAPTLAAEMAWLEQEHLRVVLLNVKHHVLGIHEVYKGSVKASLVRIGEIFREPVRRNAAAIILAHNHPSGDPTPSQEDIHVTRQIVEAGRLLDVEVLDHIVVGQGRWVSLRERGAGF